jgi:CHAT domain-containing protein
VECGGSRGQTLLALGNPAGGGADYTPLPLAAAEAQQIAALYSYSRVLTGDQASEEAFKHLAPEYDILHLACHGDLNSAYPMYSGLLLAPGGEEDGKLQVHEIFSLELSASLVVLSGCQTGLGHLTTGDELVGLSRAFIYAGTPSVLSSLWMVEDQSTAYLMSRFYQHLRSSDKAEALRLAQQETRARYPELHAWASFVLIGDHE